MYYLLHVIESCLKVTIATFCFCHSKNPSNIMKNVFDSLYILEKNFLVNKCKKQTCCEESKLCFLDVMRNGHVFPSEVCRFQ